MWAKFERLEIAPLGKNDCYKNCSRLWLTNKIKKLRGIDIEELELYDIFRLVDGDKSALFSGRGNSS